MNQRTNTARRIVLFQPAHRFGGAVQPRVELPQGLLAIGTPLDRAGYEVRIIDQRLESRWLDCAKVDGHSTVLTALSDNELQVLRDGGCTRLMIGIESASPRIQGLLNKPQDIPAIVRFNRRVARFDIRPHYFFMMGIPTETQEELAQTVDLFLHLAADNPASLPRLNIFTPYPGMADFDLAVQHGLKVPATLEEWVSFNFSTVNRYAPWLSADQKSLIRMLHFASALAIRNNFVTPYKKTHWLVRLLASIYYPIAYLRVKKRLHQFPLELKLAQWTGVYPHQI